MASPAVLAMPAKPRYLILGAAGGVGSALGRRLAASGSELFLAGRDEIRLGRLAEELGAAYAVFEATDPPSVDALVERAVETLGGLDGAAHCVGSLLLKPAHLTSPDDWRHTLDVNLSSAFYLLRSAAPALRKSAGSLVFVSSAAARHGLANHEAIAAAKAGLVGLTLSAAASYASQGMRVNCVAPGLVETPLTARITSNDASRQASEAMHALGRAGRPEEVAAAIAWLLDREQSWVTGQTLGVDGGLGSVRSRR